MPTDNLTERLKEEFARRGKIVSSSQINQILANRGISPGVAAPTAPVTQQQSLDQKRRAMWDALDTPAGSDWGDLDVVNAVGRGLWDFADTAAFGLPGMALNQLGVDPQDYLDYDNELGKWLGAGGGFFGFVAGAPMKLGVKAMRWAAQPVIRSMGKLPVGQVVKGMGKIGKDGGLSKRAIGDATKGYRSLVHRAQVNETIRGEKFVKAVDEYATQYIAKGGFTGKEAAVLREMFSKNALTRPLQDIQGAMLMKYGNNKMGRWAGHAINDIVMFAGIDTVFEAVSVPTDNEFDVYAPFWGATTGALFSTLSLLNPRGKASSWKKDFKVGLRAIFNDTKGLESSVGNMGKTELANRARFMGEAIEQSGGVASVSLRHPKTGKLKNVNLTTLGSSEGVSAERGAQQTLKEFEGQFGEHAKDVMKKFLISERKVWGKELIKWATKEEAQNLALVWKKMLLGGGLFNAHTFYNMWAHDMEADVHDILPHFLIGAYLQRRSNPNKFDLNSTKMNRLRENLMILGYHPEQLSFVPSFDRAENDMRNPLHHKKFGGFLEKMEAEGIITNDPDIAASTLGANETSLAMKPNLEFNRIRKLLVGRKTYTKNLDNISVKQAEMVVREFNKVEPDVKTESDFDKYQDEMSLKMTEGFERDFIKIVRGVEGVDENNNLKIRADKDKDNNDIVTVPAQIGIAKEIMDAAHAGELSWLGNNPETGKIYEGDAARKILIEKVDGFNAISQTSVLLGDAKVNQVGKGHRVTISTESLARGIFENVSRAEESINNRFQNNAFHVDKFTFRDNQADYVTILSHNHAIRFTREVVNIFKPEYDTKSKDGLIEVLKGAGILQQEGNKLLIVDDVNQIKIKGEKDSEEVGNLKRFLGRVVAIQSISSGEYNGTEQPITVNAASVRALRKFLSEKGYNEAKTPKWLHRHIIDFATRERIEGSDLQLNEIDTIMKLSSLGFAKVGTTSKNKSVGFRVRLIDDKVIAQHKEGQYPAFILAEMQEYNTTMKGIIKRSNGLVVAEEYRAKVLDSDMVFMLKDALPSVEIEAVSATAKLGEFLTLLGTNPKSNKFKDLIGVFLEGGGVKAQTRATQWLVESGVLTIGKESREVDVNMEKFNDTVKDVITQKIRMFGTTPDYARRIIEQADANARDRAALDTDETRYVRNITLQEFFQRFRPDGIDHSNNGSIEQSNAFDEMIFEGGVADKKNRLLTIDSVNKLIDRIHVQVDGDWTALNSLNIDAQHDYKARITNGLVGLLAGRRGQVEIKRIGWKHGRIKADTEVVQFSKLDSFFDGINIPYMIFDPMAPIWFFSPDGRRVNRQVVDIFANTDNLNEYNRKLIADMRDSFEREANIAQEIDGTPIKGPKGEVGFTVMRLATNMTPIAIEVKNLENIHEPFRKFVEEFSAEGVNIPQNVKDEMIEVNNNMQTMAESGRLVTNSAYQYALRRLMLHDMLTGTEMNAADNKRLFTDFLAERVDIDKLIGRSKLYNTKKFIRVNPEYIKDVAEAYSAIGDSLTSNTLLERKAKGDWGVVVWNDKKHATIKEEVDQIVRDLKIDWSYDWNIGDAHSEVSAFDSIAFVNASTMRFAHTMLGHNPNSINPLKPVLSGGGEGSALVLGKTLFIHAEGLENTFFRNNKNVDIMLTASGAKAINRQPAGNVADSSLIESSWDNLHRVVVDNVGQIRRISLDSLGLKPERDYDVNTGALSHADYNFYNNVESGRAYESDIQTPLESNINKWKKVAKEPLELRRWVIDEFGDGALVSPIDGAESMNHLSGLFFFASLSPDANPMSYKESVVKNKMYARYVDAIVNNSRSVTNQWNEKDSPRFGGQAKLIQAPIPVGTGKKMSDKRLLPTLIDENGRMKLRGEVMIGAHEADSHIKELLDAGMEMRIVQRLEDKELVHGPRDILGEKVWEQMLDRNWTLGQLHEFLEGVNQKRIVVPKRVAEKILIERIPPGLKVGIVVNRKPRTRPNDMGLLGLRGFLPRGYGNAIMINSLDVANVFEGDYDADAADYFFAHRKHMYDHIERTQQFSVQGIDPTRYMKPSGFHWGMKPSEENAAIDQMSADLNLYKNSIGLVQKVPRILGYFGKLANGNTINNPAIVSAGMVRENSRGEKVAPKILFEGPDYKIVMDYENTDYFTRSALETQYIIDGKGRLNGEIASDMFSWRDGFLFPLIEQSITPGEIPANGGASFVEGIRKNGSSDKGHRVRIFRRIDKNPDNTFSENQDLSRLDKAIIKTMMSEYGDLLNATGDSLYGNTGEKKRPEYSDVVDAAERFSIFNRKLNQSIYFRLRNRRIDPWDETSKAKWWQEKEFKDLFGTHKASFKVSAKTKAGKKYKKDVFLPQREIFDNTVKAHSIEYADGQRGAPIERLMHKVWDSKIFDETSHHQLVGEGRLLMDNWYNELVGGSIDDAGRAADVLTTNVKKAAFAINKKVDLIASLKKKIIQIQRNKYQSYKVKQASIEKLNVLIKDLESELGNHIRKKYWKGRRSKDLDKISFVPVDTNNMRKGTIYYSTMEQMKKFLPIIGGSDSWGLSQKGLKDLDFQKKIRSMFYGNNERLKDVLEYGDKTLLNRTQIDFLTNSIGEMSNFYEVENFLLAQGVRKHGIKYLWSFMQPAHNKYQIGVFDGRPVSVPYEASEKYDPSSRYRRGIDFLTQMAMGRAPGSGSVSDFGMEPAALARRALGLLSFTEAQFERFFNRKFDMKKMIGADVGEYVNIGDAMGRELIHDNIRLPNFNKDFERTFTNFGSIKWTRDNNRIGSGSNLMNDHLLDFYSQIMRLAGKEKEFDSYLNKMNEIQAQMIGNNIIPPIDYLSMRMEMDREVRDIANEVITKGLISGDNAQAKEVKSILNNPVFAIMGGTSYFKGLSLEKQAKYSVDRLSDMKNLSSRIERIRHEMPIQQSTESKHRDLMKDVEDIRRCYVP